MRNQTKLKKNVGTWRKRTKQLLVEYKGSKCELCGYDKCIEALEFHHINENTKEFAISGSTKSFEKQKQGTIKVLDLSNLQLSFIPDEVFELKELENFIFVNNFLEELPNALFKLEKLKKVNVVDFINFLINLFFLLWN